MITCTVVFFYASAGAFQIHTKGSDRRLRIGGKYESRIRSAVSRRCYGRWLSGSSGYSPVTGQLLRGSLEISSGCFAAYTGGLLDPAQGPAQSS